MRKLTNIALMLLCIASVAFAQQPVPPAPASTKPPKEQPEPIGDLSVLVLPFTPIGDAKASWIPDAVQQNILSELSRVTGIMPITPATRPTETLDLKSAKALADKAGAAIVLYGTYQSTEAGIRLNGQILDARNGRFIGGIKVTGTIKEIFAVEDAASDQVKRILTQHRPQQQPQQLAAGPAPALPAPAQPAPAVPAAPRVWPWDLPDPTIEGIRDRLYSGDYNRSYYNYYYSGYYGGFGYPWGIYYPGWSGMSHRHHHYRSYYGPTFFPGGVIAGRATFFPGGVVRW